MRHLEYYGYMEQYEFYGINPTSMQAEISKVKEDNERQDVDISGKTVSVEEREKNKYTIVQGGNDVGEIDTVSVIDHAKVVTIVDPDTGEEKKYLRIYFIADEQEAEETGQYCDISLDDIRENIVFNDTDTIDFNETTSETETNVTADVKDGSISQEKLTEEFSNVINEKADKSELVMVESDEPGIIGEIKKDGQAIVKVGDDGVLYLNIEGEMMNINDLIAQLAHETYQPNSASHSNTGYTGSTGEDDYGFTG